MSRTKPKGFSRYELNCFMRQKGLYQRWQQMGHSDINAVKLLLAGKPLPERTRKEAINHFLAYLINGRLTRSMKREQQQKDVMRALA